MSHKRIVIAGGSGFIGRALAGEFTGRGFSVAILTRSPQPRPAGTLEVAWDGRNPGPWTAQLDGAEAVVNLTGKNINCPHTPANLRAIIASRVDSVNALAAAVARVNNPPRVWIQASAVGFYGDTGNDICDEAAPAGNDALAQICRQWEAAFAAANAAAMRKVTLRIGVVLGRNGGALPVLRNLTKWFLGGAAGRGGQYVSWIHQADLVAMFASAVADQTQSGAFNAVAPNAVTNARFMRELRRVLRRPWSPPAPALAIRLGARLMGSEGSLALVSQRCVPQRFQAAGFPYKFTDLAAALEDLCCDR